jgi:hypothetical protein
MQAGFIGTTYVEDFEGYADKAQKWNNVQMDDNKNFYVASKTAFPGAPSKLGGHGASEKSFRYFLYAMKKDEKSEIVTYKVDLSSNNHSYLTFDYAAVGQNNTYSDQLEVLVSPDCGATWTSVFSKSGANLSTGTDKAAPFLPASTEWVTAKSDISFLDYYSEVLIKFVVTGSAKGNSLYLDNIGTGSSWPLGVSTLFNADNVSLYPNPTANNTTLSITTGNDQNVNINVYDVAGRNVMTLNNKAISAGVNTIDLNTTSLQDGVYFVEMSSDSKTTTLRLVIQK